MVERRSHYNLIVLPLLAKTTERLLAAHCYFYHSVRICREAVEFFLMKSVTRGRPRRAEFKVEVVFSVADYSSLADETEVIFALAINGALTSSAGQAS